MNDKNINSERVLDELIGRIRTQDIPLFPAETIAEIVATRNSDRATPAISKKSFQRWPVRFTAVAALLAIAIAGIWLASGLLANRGIAFGQVQEAISKTHSLTCHQIRRNSASKPGAHSDLMKYMFFGRNHVRYEWEPQIYIIDRDLNQRMVILNDRHHAILFPLYPSPEVDEWIDFMTSLPSLPESSAKRLGERDLNGRKVLDFAIHVGRSDYTVSIDPISKLPVNVETERKLANDSTFRCAYTDFVFDGPMDESLFRLKAPAGFRVENRIPPKDRPASPTPGPLIISGGQGIGPVKLGDSIEKIVELLGQPDWKEDFCFPADPAQRDGWINIGYESRGFYMLANEKTGLAHVMCYAQPDTQHRVFEGKTKEGLSMKGSKQDVIRIYGEPDDTVKRYQVTNFESLVYHKAGYEFSFSDGKLTMIFVEPARSDEEIKSWRKTFLHLGEKKE